MTQPLFENLPHIASLIRNASPVFDGTLAPIDVNPGVAAMPPGSRRALRTLEAGHRSSVAIISGRALPDLRERVRMEEIIYAGNHGLEITGPGLHFVEPHAARRVEALEELARHLQVRLRHIPGIDVEGKVLTASIHFRRASASSLAEVYQIVQDAVSPVVSLFQVTQGLKAFEIRPRVNWHKGLAGRWIQEALGWRDSLSIYMGDDVSDEDAFAALKEGVAIRVGGVSGTCAQYHL